MINYGSNLQCQDVGVTYSDIQSMLSSAAHSSGGVGLLTPKARSPMSCFCSSEGNYDAKVLRTRIQQFVQYSGPVDGFYSVHNERILFDEAFIPTVIKAVEATFWISALTRLRDDQPSTCDTVIMSCFVGLISLACGAMFVAIVSCALKIHRILKILMQVRVCKKNVLQQITPKATNIRSAFVKLKGIIALRALDQVDRAYRKLRSKMIASFVANLLITIAFGALLASAVIAAFFFGSVSLGLMSAFFGCLGGGLGALVIGMLVGIVSAICQRRYKQEAARYIQRGALYSLIFEQMQRYPKSFFKDGVAKSVVAFQAEESLANGELIWEEMSSVTACLGREGRDAQAYSFISINPLDACVEEAFYPQSFLPEKT
ncbi:hypothetical protein [Chlamydia sp.]|uniref:inclusion membrane protein GarD n=1 Tax=Chlamydia sp. TaxID=35827 RepID=UPI0025B9AFCD|nr:hypothetical protein [Chlamydia sp.]MBQ8498758.1 hypothetical protein [Chlamydia sp.]